MTQHRARYHEVEVVQTRWLSPHMIRVVFTAESLAAFGDDLHADAYVKATFVKPELGLTPPYDLAELRLRLAPEDLPVRRTYTVRWYHQPERQVAIDFVVHGDEGVAGPWAAAAVPGDHLVISSPGGAYTPRADADWHLLAGDEAALPAIAAALEAMPADAVGDAFIEVDSADEHQALSHPEGILLHWLHREGVPAGTSTVLVDAVTKSPWREGTVQVFVHGERGMVKELRNYLKDVHAVSREQLSLSGYWAYGRAEDRFQAEKREPIGQISLD
ncbi:siderophore-interacting protein [Actinopolymorpha pittospori]|uniref:NADPH-dependent ferric siderophore reductase n=1 Tax=Actinopolymorpha pittospori TaxID=648752 RepID=A0A927MZ05_9ACTN|nr:siderophore-interacting protein [Actinopolymorpha pittospori]MBE1609561.1 NADPH-dependent ferric siderophore reductase [Actinopolymorpha pittospori]